MKIVIVNTSQQHTIFSSQQSARSPLGFAFGWLFQKYATASPPSPLDLAHIYENEQPAISSDILDRSPSEHRRVRQHSR